MPSGRLRVYLGVAQGVGTTHAMLDEAARRASRGTDLVIGVLGQVGPGAWELAAALEAVSPPGVLDPDAVIRRRPDVVLIDDLHQPSRPDGDRRRWEDVAPLLAAGIDVLATADIETVASLGAVVERLTGSRPPLAVPDQVLVGADQVELVDMAPEALRRRLAHGRLVAPEALDASTSARFQPAVLSAIRELALTWMADLVARRRAEDPAGTDPDIRERILVALPGGAGSDALLQRAVRLAARMPRSVLHSVHVLGRDAVERDAQADAGQVRRAATEAGAIHHQVIGDDVASALIDVARAEHATQVVVGAPRRFGWWDRIASTLTWGAPSVASRIVRLAPDLDVHVVGTVPTPAASLSGRRPRLPRWRTWLGVGLAVVLPVLLTFLLTWADAWVGLAGEALLFLLAVVIAALVGGLWPAVLSAFLASTLLNYFFIPPLHTFVIGEPHNLISLLIFLLVAVLVGAVVHRAAAATEQATRARAESHTLAAMAEGTMRGADALATLLEHLRSSFGMTSTALLGRAADSTDWDDLGSVGPNPPRTPAEADVAVPAGEGLVLALAGRTLTAGDQKVLRAFAAQVQGLLERDRLARSAAQAARLEATERLRDALLVAVGHDLRTPLAATRAAISSLRNPELDLSAAERAELLASADQSTQRLARVLADLLDLSRLRAGSLRVDQEPVWLDDLIAPALDELGATADQVTVVAPADLPPALGDAALIARVLVNVIGNAVRHSPPGRPPAVRLSATVDRVEARVIDRGPGIAPRDRQRLFVPFQRLGDTDDRGLGLGLALSRGLVEAMNGTIEPEDTPGGGLTMVISLPVAAEAAAGVTVPGHREREENPR